LKSSYTILIFFSLCRPVIQLAPMPVNPFEAPAYQSLPALVFWTELAMAFDFINC